MKILPYEQGTEDWLKWRKSVITATECSVIMGSNPWDTPYMIWGWKLGLIPPKEVNEAMKKGQLLEPDARAQFIERYGINMTPSVVESTENNFLGASLDGLSDCKEFILEIKCGGDKLHSLALQGEIPTYYLHQIQQQLLVTGAKKCFYYSYDGQNGVCIEVYPDPKFKEEYLPKAREFWKFVAFEEAPPLQQKDYKVMHSQEWDDYSREYQELDATIKVLEEKKGALRRKLIELCEDQNCTGNGIKVMKSTVKGRIPYDDIPAIKEMDLESYRKPSTTCWKVLAKAS